MHLGRAAEKISAGNPLGSSPTVNAFSRRRLDGLRHDAVFRLWWSLLEVVDQRLVKDGELRRTSVRCSRTDLEFDQVPLATSLGAPAATVSLSYGFFVVT